jgi:SynChlorMet cassette protein ScmC
MAGFNNQSTSQGHYSKIWNLLKQIIGLDEPERHLGGFSIQLGDGNRWWFIGQPPESGWVEKMATIMELSQEKGEGSNIVALLEGETLEKRVKRLIAQDSGWLHAINNSLGFWFRKDIPDLLVTSIRPFAKDNDYFSMRYILEFVFRHSIYKGGLPFHAALVAHEGKGIILSGTSGTGKSTCCLRLSPPWQARCDDEVLVTLSPQGHYLAHPFPTWSDYVLQRGEKTYNTQLPSPLAGIFFIEQASSDAYLPLRFSEAVVETIVSAQIALARVLWCCGPEEAQKIREAIFSNTCDLLQKVPSFRLRVSLTGRFWEEIEAALAGL